LFRVSSSATLGTLLRHLVELLDGAVEARYVASGLDYRPRYTPVVRALLELRSASIRVIARHAGLTHSAASQTVALMTRAGLVRSQVGDDNRERVISLSPRAVGMVPELKRLWATTNAAARELDSELSMPLSSLVQEAIHALEKRPFGDRLKHLARDQQKRPKQVA
jgi:DNA-binding MarR family transcriptional regulator